MVVPQLAERSHSIAETCRLNPFIENYILQLTVQNKLTKIKKKEARNDLIFKKNNQPRNADSVLEPRADPIKI